MADPISIVISAASGTVKAAIGGFQALDKLSPEHRIKAGDLYLQQTADLKLKHIDMLTVDALEEHRHSLTEVEQIRMQYDVVRRKGSKFTYFREMKLSRKFEKKCAQVYGATIAWTTNCVNDHIERSLKVRKEVPACNPSVGESDEDMDKPYKGCHVRVNFSDMPDRTVDVYANGEKGVHVSGKNVEWQACTYSCKHGTMLESFPEAHSTEANEVGADYVPQRGPSPSPSRRPSPLASGAKASSNYDDPGRNPLAGVFSPSEPGSSEPIAEGSGGFVMHMNQCAVSIFNKGAETQVKL